MNTRICMIGAGAIGGVTAAYIAKAGLDVTLVTKHPEIAEISNNEGLSVKGVWGQERVRVPAVASIDNLEGQYQICMIATKAYDMPECARQMLPHLTADALVVSMQNGICTDSLSEVVGVSRTVGCVIGFGAPLKGPGELEMTSTGEFVIGLTDRRRPPLLETVRQALETVVPARIADDIYAELYSKLIVNACITALGAVCGLYLGEMMARKDARRIFLGVIDEGVRVADAIGLTIPPYGGKLNYHRLMRGSGPLDRVRRHLMIRIVGMKYSKLKSSSLQSLERGRPTEIQYFNGYIVRKGAQAGIVCPINARLTEIVEEIEQGKRHISTDNLSVLGLTSALDEKVG